MRYLVVSVLLIMMLLPALPGAAAQEDAPLAEDGEGDVEARVAGTQADALAQRSGAADLTALRITEKDDGFLVRIDVRDLSEQTAPTFLDGVTFLTHFTFHDTQFVARMSDDRDLLGGSYAYGRLYAVETTEDGYEDRDYRAGLDVTLDRDEHFLEALLPRDALTDSDGAPPGRGDDFTSIWVESTGFSAIVFSSPAGPQGGIEVSDRMPDDGTVGPLPITVGIQQSGDARLGSQSPFRVSNGGATTVVYEVGASNHGERQTFELGVEGVPEGWSVSLPFDRVVLDDGENLTFPVLLTTPSGHSHGGLDAFILTLTGQRDNGDVGRIELGLKYTDIPQPAGHHPRLFFHSHQPYGSGTLDAADEAVGANLFRYVQAYMNAAEEDPGDLGVGVPGQGNTVPGLGSQFWWYMPLSPRLAMGLDFDTSQTGTIEVPIQYDYVAQDVTVSAQLTYWDPQTRERITLATAPPSTPASWSQGTENFALSLDMEDAADFLPFVDDAYVELRIELEGQFVGPGPFGPGANPTLAPGGFMDLPLREYRDNVDAFYKAVEGLKFSTDFLERPVNPGEAIVFETTLRNDGSHAEPVTLELTGVNSEWARILGADAFEMAPGESRTVAVAVAVPGEISDGSVADLVMQAASERDVHRRAVIDLIAIVDEEADHPDEQDRIEGLDEDLQEAGKKSPGFEIAAVAMGLLAIAVVLRRRQA